MVPTTSEITLFLLEQSLVNLFHPVFNPKRGEEKLKGRHPKRERVVMFAFGNGSTTKPSMFYFANLIMSGRAWRFHPLTK